MVLKWAMRYYSNDPKFGVPVIGLVQCCCGLKGLRESDSITHWTIIRVPCLALSLNTLNDAGPLDRSDSRRPCRDVS